MEFITTGNRIAVENFDIGKIYTITWQTGNYKSLACTGKGTDFVMFQDQEPDLLYCLTMDSAISISSIEEGGGGSGTINYNELENKPSINGFVLVGNKTGADLGLASQSDLEDYATNASVVAGLSTKQDALSSSQLAAVNSGITSALVTQIGTNTSAIAGKQDALSSSQLAAVNSGIASADVAQITTNKNNILSLTPTVLKEGFTLSTAWRELPELRITIPANTICRVSAMQTFNSADPTGLILSYGDTDANRETLSNLWAKAENSAGGTVSLEVSAIIDNNTSNARTLYVWATAKASGTNFVRAIYEKLA